MKPNGKPPSRLHYLREISDWDEPTQPDAMARLTPAEWSLTEPTEELPVRPLPKPPTLWSRVGNKVADLILKVGQRLCRWSARLTLVLR